MGEGLSYMDEAIEMALMGADKNEVPVGAVVVYEPTGEIIARTHNNCENSGIAIHHAEILAIIRASEKLQSKNLQDCSIFVTMEPCAMCAMALSHAKMGKIYFGCYDFKSGGVEHGACVFNHAQTHHKPEVIGGIQEMECKKIIQDFFLQRR